jgi:hypothetical protein
MIEVVLDGYEAVELGKTEVLAVDVVEMKLVV